jgi:hypothetical protein
MQSIHDNWRKFLTEGTYRELDETKLLREIEEDELEHIRRALDEMGPEDLAFNELFGGKNRILIPFPVADTGSELGQFISILKLNMEDTRYDIEDWTANFETGLMSRVKPLDKEELDSALMASLMSDPGTRPKQKKESMKIGKWLSRVERAIQDALIWYAAVEDSGGGQVDKNELRRWEERTAPTLIKLIGSKHPIAIKGRFQVDRVREIPEKIVQLRRYWQQNAGYIKENPEGIKDKGTYSIVITRHPIDVLRMSDFDDINSCHSPPSRKDSADITYYKCAVAEAHGHGAIAYVVENEHLEEAYETPDLKELANASDFQEEEMFWDESRAEGLIEPISRLRLRQVRHYKDRDKVKRWDEGTEIAIPEKRIYGKKIPGFRETVVDWARENQSEAIAAAPSNFASYIKDGERITGDHLDLDHFVKFGGSHEDNHISDLIRSFLQADKILGRIVQNTETEDQLDINLIGGVAERLEAEAQEALDRASLTYFKVDFSIDHGEDYAWIDPTVRLKLSWDESEWKSLPGYAEMQGLPHHFEDYGHPYDSISHYNPTVNKVGSEIIMHLHIDTAKMTQETGTFYAADEFEEFLRELDKMEYTGGVVGGIKALTEQYMKREGAMEGGALINLGHEVLNRDFTSYTWDLEATEGYEMDEFELISATTLIGMSYENTTLEAAERILGSREYWLELRRQMHVKPQEYAGEEYYVAIEKYAHDVEEDEKIILYRLNYHLGDDAPDGQVEVFKELLEFWEDEDELAAKVQEVFDSFIKKAGTLKQVDPELNINENKRVSGQQLFNNWRKFCQ